MFKKIVGPVFVFLVAIVPVTPVVAQDTAWRIDSEHSTARLFLASSKSPKTSVNVGVARMSGTVIDIGDDASKSVFDFTIYPADETPAGTLSHNSWSGKNPPAAAANTVITFKSERVEPMGGGKYRVTGELALMYTERSTTYDPTEAFAGPVYGPPVVHTEKQEAVFDFQQTGASAMQARKRETSELSGSSVIRAEDYPELYTSVSAMKWPAFVEDQHCTWPSDPGEADFSGPVCTGKTVGLLPRTDIRCEVPLTVGAEDFSGEVCTGSALQMAPTDAVLNQWENQHRDDSQKELIANEVMIQLDMKLARTDTMVSENAGR